MPTQTPTAHTPIRATLTLRRTCRGAFRPHSQRPRAIPPFFRGGKGHIRTAQTLVGIGLPPLFRAKRENNPTDATVAGLPLAFAAPPLHHSPRSRHPPEARLSHPSPRHVVHIIKVVLVAGAERHLLSLLPALRERGVRSTILLLTEPDTPMADYAALAADHDIPLVRETIHGHADPGLVGRLRGHLRRLSPDLVHTHLLHADLYGLLAARSLGLPVVTSRHNDNAFRRRLPMRALGWLWWRLTHEGIAISDAIREFAIAVEGARPAHMTTVRYGVVADALTRDVPAARAALRAELNLPDDALLVGTMSRLIEQKGLTYGLQAFAQVQDRHPNAHLVVSGSGVLRDALAAEADALGLRAHFLGWRPDPATVLAGYDLLLMPSLWEGFGLVMLEAMAQRLPIVASRVSAIPEVVIDGETGLLVPPRDVDALASALDALLTDPDRRTAYGAAAHARLHIAFGAGRMADETLTVYQRAIVKNFPNPPTNGA